MVFSQRMLGHIHVQVFGPEKTWTNDFCTDKFHTQNTSYVAICLLMGTLTHIYSYAPWVVQPCDSTRIISFI